MRSIVARRIYCESISLVHSHLLSFCPKTFKYIIRSDYLSIISISRDFIDISKNARSKRTIVPFLDLLLSHSPLIESFCRSKPDHFWWWVVQTHGHTDGHTSFLETLPHNRPFGQWQKTNSFETIHWPKSASHSVGGVFRSLQTTILAHAAIASLS